MKFKPDKKYLYVGITIFLTAVAIMLAYFLFFRIDSIKDGLNTLNKILAPIFYGLIIAYLMTPLLNTIEKKWLIPVYKKYDWKIGKSVRRISISLTVLIVFFLLYLFFASVIPQLYVSIQTLVSQYSVYTANFVKWINKTLDTNPEIAKMISNLVYDYSNEADDFLNDFVLPSLQSFLLPNIKDMVSSLSLSVLKAVKFIWNVIIGIIISIYVLAGKENFAQGSVRMCYAFMNNKSANKFIDSVRFTHRTFIGFLSGKVIDSAIIGVLCYICCLIIHMPYALLVSVIVGVTNIIPFFGPYIGAIPSTIIILLVDPKKALAFIILILVLQQFDGNFLGPKILSQSTGLTSFWIISSITLFGGLFGIVGMIIGVPITAVIAAGIENTIKTKLSVKNLPTEPEKYFEVGEITETGEFTHYEYHKQVKAKTDFKKTKFFKFLSAVWCFLKKAGILIWELLKSLGLHIASFAKKLLNNRKK